MRRHAPAAFSFLCLLFSSGGAMAQRAGADWMTSGFDAQRSSWVRTDGKISPESMRKPGFDLVWKMKFENTARQLNTIMPPALLDFYIGYRGFRTLGFFGASADKVIAVDTDLARAEWEKGTGAAGGSGTLPCPGGMTSAVTRPTMTAYPAAPTGRGAGRGTPARSGVGQPYEGAVTLKTQAAPRPVPPPKPAAGGAAAAAAFNPFAPRIQWVLALSGDGKLHSLYVSNGEEPNAAVPFVPAGANARGLIAFDNTAYVATTNRCGGADDGVWALDLATKKVTQWKAPGKGVAGSAGPAVGPDGTLYVATGGGELVALAAKTLERKGAYQSGGVEFTSSPVVFEFKGKNLVAVASGDGRIHLVDSANLGNAMDKSETYSAAGYQAGSLTSWQDASGTRWLLAPGAAAVTAWKVVEKDGGVKLEQGWVSRELTSPLAPIVVNGVVFALSSGEFRSNDARTTVQRSGNAVLYALDGATGKELWNSGGAITSFVHSGGLAAGGGRVYVATYEGTQYAFGFPMEH